MNKAQPTYLMVPRKLVIAVFVVFLSMLIMTILSIQYANYVDSRSNQRWCGIVHLFNDTYKTNPPPTEIGKKLSIEFKQLQHEFKCKST